MSDLVAYIDGGSLGNPGPSGIGVVIQFAQGRRIKIAKWIGRQDNNVAEYVALLEASLWGSAPEHSMCFPIPKLWSSR